MHNSPEKNTRSPELTGWVFEPIHMWAETGRTEGQPTAIPSYWAGILNAWWGGGAGWAYVGEIAGIDPFITDLKYFFSGVYDWIMKRWAWLYTWFQDLFQYIQYLWNSIVAGMVAMYEWLGERIEGIITLIGNWASILWEWLISDIWAIVDYLIAPLREIWDYLASVLAEWFERIRAAIAAFMTDPAQWVYDLGAEIWEALKALSADIWNALIETANAAAAWIGEKVTDLAPVIVEHFRDLVVWVWDVIKAAFVFVKDDIIPAVSEATSGALGWLKDQFTHLMGLAYKEILDYAKAYSPMTPERAVTLAAVMFGSAVGFGALAHGIALGVEMLPNLKYMGVHYLSAFAARMGSFGTISSATMGVIAAVSLRRPMTYYLQSMMRPIQPSERDLMMMAVKPDISMDIFRQGMAYQGYSDYWIGRYAATMYHEPRYFELSMMAEDESATAAWLYTKARRSGYSEDDSKIFVASIGKKAARTQRQDFYKQAFNLFKEGYIPESTFKGYLDQLEMRPEAQEFAVNGANLAYQYDLYRDLISAHRTAYRNDLITEDEFSASLAALGMTPDRVSALAYIEWVRKTPSAIKKERREIESAWAEVQKKYTQVYIEAFEKGLIGEGQLAAYLIALGIKERVAQATARYEALKLIPKPKREEVGEEVIPAPPMPPAIEE